MNLLAVDIGNTDIKFGIFRDGALTKHWRASGTRTHPERFSALLRESLSWAGVEFDAVVYCSVVPEIEAVFRKTIKYCYNLPDKKVFAVKPGAIRLPLDLSAYPLDQLGMDRLVNACSAAILWPNTSLIVVDFGTATTLDLITSSGKYLGGAITPGLDTFANILSQKTAKLPPYEINPKLGPALAMGRNTMECMEAGILIGYRGIIKELIAAAEVEIKASLIETDKIRCVATGGLADTVLTVCDLKGRFEKKDPMLTLRGLYGLYQYNTQSTRVASPAQQPLQPQPSQPSAPPQSFDQLGPPPQLSQPALLLPERVRTEVPISQPVVQPAPPQTSTQAAPSQPAQPELPFPQASLQQQPTLPEFQPKERHVTLAPH